MRIGVVTTSYPRHDGDHAGNFVAAHVAALRAAGHEVDVVGAHTIASPLFDGGGAPDALERGGVATWWSAARFSARLTVEVSRRAASWDLAIAHWLVPSAVAAAIAQRAPCLAIAHGGDVHTLRRLRLLAPTLHVLRARGVKLAFVSTKLRDLAVAASPRLAGWLDGALVQPMGIEVAHFEAIRAARALASPPTIVVVARLVPVKGVDVAIRAFVRLRTEARLVIAGDGPARRELETLAREVDARGISFVGAVDAAHRDELLKTAACVVIPSRVLPNGRTEGAPMIALEALASGVPVVASAVGGLRDLLGGDPGSLVAPHDPAALADAIERALASTSRALPDLNGYDWPRVSERLFDHALGCALGPRGPTSCEAGDSNRRRTA